MTGRALRGSLLESAAAGEVADVIRELGDAPDVEEAAERTISRARELTGARWAELVEPRPGGTLTIWAATDVELSRQIFRAAGQQGPEIPGLEPTADQIVITDLPHDERWPAFAAAARASLPVRSAILQFLAVNGRYAAGLAVYDDRPDHFTPDHQRALRALGVVAGIALAGHSSARQATNLAVAVESNRTIATAVGILMSSLRLTQPDAFARLVEVSQHSNRKLRDVAADVLLTGTLG